MSRAAALSRTTLVGITATLLALALIAAFAAQPAAGQDDGGPVAVDPTSCGHFETQADATEALHSVELPDAENLDPDGDGIACEMRWPVDADSPPAVYEPTSCGHFETQADAQEAFDSGELPDPENLDADGDGIVCEFRWGEVDPDTGEAPSGDAETASAVVALPDTGTGSAAVGGRDLSPVVILVLASIAGTLSLRALRLDRQAAS